MRNNIERVAAQKNNTIIIHLYHLTRPNVRYIGLIKNFVIR